MKKGCILILQLFVLLSINVTPTYAKVQITEDVGMNNNLSDVTIDIDGYNLNFNPNIRNYILTIGDETKLNIKTNYNNSKVIIGGNENLKNGSIITITFVENNNNKNTYIIKIQKKAFNQIYFIIIIFILLIINITRILINSTKKEKII